LSELQKALIREHPRIGCQIIRDIETPWPIAEIIAQHHERLDGSGYPEGLSGDQICLEARIVGVADVLEALTAHRPHRPALGLAVAVARLKHGRGTIYDSDVVDACLALTDHPVKCQALLGRSS
jgi:HD-GYP domain-containing protein (c-di-GMP phosphodiesterase class II)